MAEQNCANCSFRAKYDSNPKSFLGRVWRWHINWCPGWKGYITTLPEDERAKIAEQYNFKKYQ